MIFLFDASTLVPSYGEYSVRPANYDFLLHNKVKSLGYIPSMACIWENLNCYSGEDEGQIEACSFVGINLDKLCMILYKVLSVEIHQSNVYCTLTVELM